MALDMPIYWPNDESNMKKVLKLQSKKTLWAAAAFVVLIKVYLMATQFYAREQPTLLQNLRS